MNLADAIRKLRGEQTYLEFCKRTRVNRNSLAQLEKGQPVKLSTLEQIAAKMHLTDEQWLPLLIGWIQAVVGIDNARKLSIHPAHGFETALILKDAESKSDSLRHYFATLSTQEQDQILKTIQRQEVLRCLAPINQVYERFTAPAPDTKNHLSTRC